MTWTNAIESMMNNYPPDTDALEEILLAVEPLCKADTTGTTSLYDWLYSGSYDGSETPESLADEWDALATGADDDEIEDLCESINCEAKCPSIGFSSRPGLVYDALFNLVTALEGVEDTSSADPETDSAFLHGFIDAETLRNAKRMLGKERQSRR